jgi:hypothetical protein
MNVTRALLKPSARDNLLNVFHHPRRRVWSQHHENTVAFARVPDDRVLADGLGTGSYVFWRELVVSSIGDHLNQPVMTQYDVAGPDSDLMAIASAVVVSLSVFRRRTTRVYGFSVLVLAVAMHGVTIANLFASSLEQ